MSHRFPALAPADAHRPPVRHRRDLIRPALQTVLALMLREMSTRYGRNPGGYAWAILEPLGAMLVLSIGFSLILRSPSLGSSFLLFYASGYLPYYLYQTVARTVGRAIGFSRPLLHYPAVTRMDAIAARFVLNTLSAVLVSVILLTAIRGLIETGTLLDLGPVLQATALSAALGLGIGTLNCGLGRHFPVWDIIWGIATRPLFLASAVIYVPEDLPRSVQEVLWWNPLVHVTGLMRTGLYPMYAAQYVSVAFVTFVVLISLVFGLLLLRRDDPAGSEY